MGNKLFPGMFALNDGGLVQINDDNIKAVQENRLHIQYQHFSDDSPLTDPNPEQHPITGIVEKYCLFDWLVPPRQYNNKKRGMFMEGQFGEGNSRIHKHTNC